LATERWILAGGGTAQRWKSPGSSNLGSKRVLRNTVPGKVAGSGQWSSSGVQQAGIGFMPAILHGAGPAWVARRFRLCSVQPP